MISKRLPLATVVLVLFAACADSNDDAPPSEIGDSGVDSPAEVDSAATDASVDADADVDAAPQRCSNDFCLVDTPDPVLYGATSWSFLGVYTDSVIGTWAIANGGVILHVVGGAWTVATTVTLPNGSELPDPVALTSIAGDHAGHLLVTGNKPVGNVGVIVKSDGTTFTVSTLESSLNASWVAAPNDAWVVGGGGRIFHSSADGGWEHDGPDAGEFQAVWGTDSDNVYVGGAAFSAGYGSYFGYVTHRTPGDGGGGAWSSALFDPSSVKTFGASVPGVRTGIAIGDDSRWAGGATPYSPVLAHEVTDAGDAGEGGTSDWQRDSFQPPVFLASLWANTKTDIWAVGAVGRIYHYDGTSWKDALLVFNGAPLMANLTGIAGTSAGELWIVGTGVSLRKAP